MTLYLMIKYLTRLRGGFFVSNIYEHMEALRVLPRPYLLYGRQVPERNLVGDFKINATGNAQHPALHLVLR